MPVMVYSLRHELVSSQDKTKEKDHYHAGVGNIPEGIPINSVPIHETVYG